MDPSAALLAGLAAGLAIAVQVGAVSLLLVEAAVVAGPRVGLAAGMGVATADLAFAIAAATAGGAAGALLAEHEGEIRVAAALVLAAIAVHGLVALRREEHAPARPVERPAQEASARLARVAAQRSAQRPAQDAAQRPAQDAAERPARTHYLRFLAITAANPLTIASFAAVAASLPLGGAGAAAAFAAGVGLASAGWHLLLTLAAGHAGRWITLRIRRGLAIGGRLAVLAIAVQLALAA